MGIFLYIVILTKKISIAQRLCGILSFHTANGMDDSLSMPKKFLYNSYPLRTSSTCTSSPCVLSHISMPFP